MVEETQQHYIDPWQEYKTICGKLKKRFLRKPNVAEATRDFAGLANRLHQDDMCPNYSGLCHLAIARCEHQINNVSGEAMSLKQAARLFMEAENDRRQLTLPSFHQNLNSAIHCYGHAIKSYVEQKHLGLAADLCMELGVHLVNMDQAYEAVEYFERATKFYDTQPWGRSHAFDWLIICFIIIGQAWDALRVVTEARSFLFEIYTVNRGDGEPLGIWRQRLSDYEIAEVLLLLSLDPLPQHMTESQMKLMEKYVFVGDTELPARDRFVSDEDCFLYLQSFVMAVGEKDYCSADASLTSLESYLKPFLFDLAMQIVENLENDG